MARKAPAKKQVKQKKAIDPHIQELMNEGAKILVCECGHKSFELKIEQRKWFKICKSCHKKIDI